MTTEISQFEILEECIDERLKLIFRNKDERKEQINSLEKEGYKLKSPPLQEKTRISIEYLDKFKEKFPLYEYTINYKRDNFRKIPESFSIWYIEIARNISVDQYFYNELNR